MSGRTVSSPLQYRPRSRTNAIILHDSHSAPAIINGEDFLCLRGRSMGLLTCGYHFIVDRDGQVVECRKHSVMGTHCPGRNHDSIGVCLMGGLSAEGLPEDNILAGQWKSLRTLVAGIRGLYGPIPVIGHSEVQHLRDGRVCPCVPPKEISSLNDRHA